MCSRGLSRVSSLGEGKILAKAVIHTSEQLSQYRLARRPTATAAKRTWHLKPLTTVRVVGSDEMHASRADSLPSLDRQGQEFVFGRFRAVIARSAATKQSMRHRPNCFAALAMTMWIDLETSRFRW
jgi:hypothetical protein